MVFCRGRFPNGHAPAAEALFAFTVDDALPASHNATRTGDDGLNRQPGSLLRDRAVLCVLGLLCAYFLFELVYYWLGQSQLRGFGTLLLHCALALIVGKIMLWLSNRKQCSWHEGILYAFFAALTALPRLVLILAIQVEPQSDYAFYYQSALSLAQTGVFPVTDYNIAVAPNTLTYIGMLGGVLKLLGGSVLTAQIFNLLLSTGTVLISYALARRLVNKNMAILASTLFALWPNHVLFSLCIASEPLALFFFMGGLYAAVRCFEKSRIKKTVLNGFAAGVLLGISGCVRSNAAAALAAALLYAALYMLRKENRLWQSGLFAMAAIALGYFAVDALWGMIARHVYQAKLGITFGWALYEGLDTVGNGSWTQEGHDALMRVMSAYPPERVQGQMLKLALEKASAYDFATWFHLIARKGLNIWLYSDYAYGAVLAAQNAEQSLFLIDPSAAWLFDDISFLQRFLLVLFSVQGVRMVVRGWRKGVQGMLLLLTFPILGFVVFHSFATSIPRYQYMAVPLFLLATALMVRQLGDYAVKKKRLVPFVRGKGVSNV